MPRLKFEEIYSKAYVANVNEEADWIGMKIAELQAILDYLDAPEEAPETFPYDIRPADTYGI